MAFAAVCALVLSVCGREPTGPGGVAGGQLARLVLEPGFAEGAIARFQTTGVVIDNVHVVIRAADGTIVFDEIVPFAPGQTEVSVTAKVPVHGESERFSARFELRSGTRVMFEGAQDVTARAGESAPPTTVVPQTFVGPGATATQIVVTPAATTLLPGATLTLTANVTDAANAPVPGALLSWTSSNPAVAAVSSAGVVTAGAIRGSAIITAATMKGVTGSATVNVILPPARLVVEGGDGQSARVGSALPQAFAVQVQASDGVGVSGVAVSFAALSAGSTVGTATVASDATGRASTAMTLGGALGPQSFRATAAGFSVTVTATGTPGLPATITLVSGNAQTDSVGRPLPLPFVIRVADAFGNLVPNAPVTWARTTGAGTLTTAANTTDALGVAQNSYTLGAVPGPETIVATVTTAGGTASVTITATAIARQAASLSVVSGGGQSATVGLPLALPLVVIARDAIGNLAANASVVWTISGGTLSAAGTTTNASGQTQVTVTIGPTPGVVAVTGRLASNPSAQVSFTFIAAVGAPSRLIVSAGDGQSAPAGSPVAVAPAARVTDASGNSIAGVSVTFTPSAGGSVAGSPATTNAQGIATLGSWTLGSTPGPQTLTASGAGLSLTFNATASAPVGPPVLAMVTQPSATVQNTAVFAQQPSVQLKTAGGANILTAGVVVSVAVQTPGPVLRGVVTATTNASGVATFAGLSLLGTVGANALVFSAPTYTGVTSSGITITPGPAVYLSATTAQALTGSAGAVVAPNPTVVARDSSLNAVNGVAVTFAPFAGGNGTVSGGGVVTAGAGTASPTSWTLDATVGIDTVTATSAGLVGSPVFFLATSSAGVATQLAIVSGNNQTGVTGNALAAPMIVIAKDALNNPVSGINLGFSVTAGGGTPASQIIMTNAGGQSSFTLTLGPPGAQTVQVCLPGCTATTTFNATSIPVGANAVWTGASSTDWSTASNWSPAVVPTGANSVFIPNGVTNAPVLTATSNVGDIAMASGASLNVGAFNLNVGGNVAATGAVLSGAGYFYFCGGTHSVVGTTAGLVADCGSTVNAGGVVAIGPGLSVFNSSVFAVNAAVVTVTGNMDVFTSSRVQMVTAGGHLLVTGNVNHAPGNDVGDTWMTDGILEIRGNLTGQFSGPGQSFRAVGNHITRFSGTGPQSINFQYSHEGYHRETFGNLEFTGGNTVTILNNMRVHGTVLVNNGTNITSAGLTIYHLGQLTATAGTNLSGLASTQLNGGGAIFPLVAGVGPATVEIAGGFTVTLPSASVTVPTNLATHSGAVLDLEAKSLVVTGAFSMNSGSRVKMIQAAAYFRVDGTYTSVPGNDVGDTWMTDGVLELRGNLTGQFSGPGQSFRAVGAHITRFNGTGSQSITFQYSHEGYHRETFGKLEFSGGNTVTLLNNIRAHSTVLVNNNTIVTGAGLTIYHIGQLTTTTGTNLSGLASTQLNGGGAIFPLVTGVGPPTVEIAGGFTVTLPSASVTLPTSLATHSGTVLDLEAKSLVVTGAFSMNSSSRVKMIQAAAYFRVDGNYSSVPGTDVGDTWMTDGVLELRGNLTGQFSGPGQSFRAVGNHLTRFSGTGPQSINFQYSHEGYHRETFGNLEFTGANTVTLLNNMRAHGTVLVNNNTIVTGGGRTLYHLGQLTTTAGTNLSGLASTQLNGGGAIFPLVAGVGPATVEIAGGFTVTLPSASVTVPTNLATHSGAVLDLEAKSLIVTGSFSMNSSSRVKMIQAAAFFRVDGSYTSVPGNDVGDTWMTDGVLELRGNLTGQFGGPGQSFRAFGNHLTRFSGAGPQSINFQYSHEGYHRETFGKLEFTGANTVTILNNIRAHSTVLVNNNTIVSGAGLTIYHLGQLTTAAGTNLSGLASTQLNGGGAIFPLVAGVGPATVEIAGGFTVTLPSASVTLPTSLATHSNAVLDLEAKSLVVTGSFSMNSGSRVKMTQAAAYFRVDGNYTSASGTDVGDTWMTNGVLELKGDLLGQFGGPGQSFRAVGAHTTRFSGTVAQAMTFQYAHEGNHRETFGNLEVTNSGGGVSVGSTGAQVLGTFNLSGIMTVGVGKLLNVGGAVTLQSGSTINALGTISRGSCTNLGATITGSGLICP